MTIEFPNPLVLSPENLVRIFTAAGLDPVAVAMAAAQSDAGGRVRTSHPEGLFDSSQEYDSHPLLWEHLVSGTGTATYTQAQNSTVLATGGAAAGARALRRTKVYWRYQPGKSQLVKMTAALAYAGTPALEAEARLGYFDDANGVFFGRDATGVFACVRSDTTGSVVDTKIRQADWSDPMDGTGPSRAMLDFTKTNIFAIDFLWLGSGNVRFWVKVGGRFIKVAEAQHENQIVGPYMRTANLPLSWEVVNGAGGGASIQMLATCASIESEGGATADPGFSFRAGNAQTTRSCGTAALIPLFSIRLRDTFGGLTYRGHVHPEDLSFINTAASPAYFEVLWNASLTGATWAGLADSTNSGVEFDTAATAVTGGVALSAGYLSAGGVGSNPDTATASGIQPKLVLGRTSANVRDTITVAARGIGGTAALAGNMNFLEQR